MRDAAADGFWLADAQGRLLEVNEAYCRMSGFTAGELAQMRIHELEAARSEAEVAAHLQRIVARGEDRFETQHRRKDGAILSLEVGVQYRPAEGGRLVVFLRDITERRRMEKAIEERLEALTRPLDQPDDITLEALFELAALQRVQDEFAAATGVASIITRPDGRPITRPSGFCRLCNDIIRRTELGCQNCYRSDALLGRQHPEGPVIQPCLSGGLWDAGASITVGDRHIANWLIGQVRDGTQSEDRMREYARQIGADEEAVVEAFREVPAMSLERFRQVAQALFTLAKQLSTTAYQNVQQARFIHERGQAERRLALAAEVLAILNESHPLPDAMDRIVAAIQRETGVDAAAIRLRDGEDFPYFVHRGFAEEFLAQENSLLTRDDRGDFCRDANGQVSLECTCGLVLSGRTDPANALFTKGGSAWTNDTRPFLDVPASEDPRLRPRNRCIRDGYQSVALIPVRAEQKIIGLLQLNAREKNRFSLELVQFLEGISASVGVAVMRRQAEEERGRLEAQLHQAQKMESVGRLAGGVAHDFNNMLQAILGNVDLLLSETTEDSPARDCLQEIRNCATHSANLTRQLLAFARRQTIAPKVLDLNEVVEGLLKMMRRLIGEDIRLIWQPDTALWHVKVDPTQIDQVLANLCVNARDAIQGVGTVTVETGNATLDEAACEQRAGLVPGDYVWLTVSDDGCGMSKEVLGRLFEPFFTTKPMGEGTGLGLATVYGVVNQNNGLINVYSEPGKGTTFKIYLPRHDGPKEGVGNAKAAETARSAGETVLVVEDEPAILVPARRALERLGYLVLVACSPVEAIQLVKVHAGPIHLLITDVVMPEMNGRDLSRELLALRPGLKCLFMSGYTANIIAHRGVLDEGIHFIQKPFSMSDLAVRVRAALEE